MRSGYSPSELQGSKTRHLTPWRFAELLVSRVREAFSVRTVAALYVDLNGVYTRMDDVEYWGVSAEHYAGPHPIVAHPPCGPWGKCRTLCKYQRAQCGIEAIELVHRWGGVIEHPVGSTLFRDHGRVGAVIEQVDQHDWGHKIHKPTLLYWVR